MDGDRVGTLLDVAGEVARARSSFIHSFIQGISVEHPKTLSAVRGTVDTAVTGMLKVWRREMDKKAADK